MPLRSKVVVGTLVAFGAAVILYGLTVSRHYTSDGLIYALIIESPSAQTMIDPTHLLLHPLGWSWVQLWQVLGWTGRALLPLQLLNSLAGATCVGLMFVLAFRLSGTLKWSYLVTLGFALSGGLWLLSVEAEFVTVPLALQMVVLSFVLGVQEDRFHEWWYAILMGLAVGIAILSFASSTILIVVILVALSAASLPRKKLLARMALFLGTVLLVICPAYFFGLWAVAGFNLAYLARFTGGSVYGVLEWSNLPHGIYAFLRTFGLYPKLVMNDSTQSLLAGAETTTRLLFLAYYLALASFVLLPAICVARCDRTTWASDKQPIVILASWSLPFAAFAFIWVPADITFWMPLLVAWWLTACLLCTPGASRYHWAFGLGFVTLIGFINATQVIFPRTDLESNQAYLAAQHVAEMTGTEDVILVQGTPFMALTVAYFAQRPVHMLPPDPVEAERALTKASTAYEGRQLYILEKTGLILKLE